MRTVRLVLGKFPVVEVKKSIVGFSAKLKVGDGMVWDINVPHDFVDIRPGDLLTLHTDVALKDRINALPEPASKQ